MKIEKWIGRSKGYIKKKNRQKKARKEGGNDLVEGGEQ